MLRAIVATGFLLLAVLLSWLAFQVGVNTPTGTLLVNLGTEVFGILITVALVEWLFERRRLQDRARDLAWSVLHSMQRALWVWQGGPPHMGTAELLGIVAGVRNSDPVPAFTEALFLNLGTRCRELLQREHAALRTMPGLPEVLDELTSLSSVRDGSSVVSIHLLSEILEAAITNLARVLNQPTQRIPAALIRYRDTSVEAQEERYYDARARLGPETEPGPGSSPLRSGTIL